MRSQSVGLQVEKVLFWDLRLSKKTRARRQEEETWRGPAAGANEGQRWDRPYQLASALPSLWTVGSSFLVSARQTDLRGLAVRHVPAISHCH